MPSDSVRTFPIADGSPAQAARTAAYTIAKGNGDGLILLLILGTGLIDWAWSLAARLSFTGWIRPGLTVCVCALIWAFYSSVRSRPRLAEMAAYGGLWIGFSACGCILTYLAASVPRPLADDAFSAFDVSLGFNWLAWANHVQSHPTLQLPLVVTYFSLMPQILGSIVLFSLAGVWRRNQELLMNAIVALLMTSLISALWPSLGPGAHLDWGQLDADMLYVVDVLKLRSGAEATFDLGQMKGIVTFPSYHTVLALLLIIAHRGSRWSFPFVIVMNGLMLLSIPSEGGHYVADMVAGMGVTMLTIVITRAVRTPRIPAIAP